MDWLSDYVWQAWVVLGLLLAGVELLSLDLFLASIALGCFAAAITSVAGGSLSVQLAVAAAVSVALLLVIRPRIVARIHDGPDLLLGPDTFIGKIGVVTTAIDAHTPGRIKVAGEMWSAISVDDQPIAVGTDVEVLEINGATARVAPKQVGA